MYIIRDREAGNEIERVKTLEDAEWLVEKYEEEDRDDESHTDNFYEIIEDHEMNEAAIRYMLKDNTHWTSQEIEKQIKAGIWVYESYEEFEEEVIGGLGTKEDAEDSWSKLEVMEYDGKQYRVDWAV